jgi:hypothetical protein
LKELKLQNHQITYKFLDDPRNIEVTPDDLSKPGSKLAAAQQNDAECR